MKADWKRKISTYKKIAVQASDRRIEDREAVLNIFRGAGSLSFKVDRIIDHFRERYEGTKYLGLPLRTRLGLFKKYDGRCMWCGKEVVFASITVEHIVPISEGGTNDWDNLGCSCVECNSKRDGISLNRMGYLKR